MPSACQLFWASGVLILPSVAAAQAPAATSTGHGMRLSWVRSASAASCPDAGRIEADVAERLGWSPFSHPTAASESLEASVTHDNAVWRATIELRAADGTSLGSRAVESPAPTCTSLAAAAGLAIALMIEPLLPPKPEARALATESPLATGSERPASLGSKRVSPVPPNDPNREAQPSPSSQKDDDTSGHLGARGSLALGAVATTGILPRVAFGATITGSAQLSGRLFGTVSASLLPEQQLQRDGAEVGFGMTLGAIGPCYEVPLQSAWTLSGCVAVLVGSLQIAVKNPEPLTPGARLWWGVRGGLRLSWNAGAFEAALEVDALEHIARHSYSVEHAETSNSTPLFVEPAGALMGSLVAGVRF